MAEVYNMEVGNEIKVTCLNKYRNSKGVVTHYTIKNILNNETMIVERDELKSLMRSEKIQVDNLKLTSANKIIHQLHAVETIHADYGYASKTAWLNSYHMGIVYKYVKSQGDGNIENCVLDDLKFVADINIYTRLKLITNNVRLDKNLRFGIIRKDDKYIGIIATWLNKLEVDLDSLFSNYKEVFGDTKFIESNLTNRNLEVYDFFKSIDLQGITPKGNKMELTFLECTKLETVLNIPDGIVKMNNTFNGCRMLKKVSKLPSKLKEMRSTFSGCISLNGNIVIPNTVKNIEYTFREYEKDYKSY